MTGGMLVEKLKGRRVERISEGSEMKWDMGGKGEEEVYC